MLFAWFPMPSDRAKWPHIQIIFSNHHRDHVLLLVSVYFCVGNVCRILNSRDFPKYYLHKSSIFILKPLQASVSTHEKTQVVRTYAVNTWVKCPDECSNRKTRL